MTIYHVDAGDRMNSTISNDRVSLGYFARQSDADDCARGYNEKLSPASRQSSFKAVVTTIEVKA